MVVSAAAAAAHATLRTTASGASVNRPLWVWVAVGVLGYLAFPWYAQQDANGLLAVGQVFSGEQAANGLMQAALFGRPWLWLGLVGLVVAGLGACLPAGRKQGAVLVAGGALGLAALLLSGFAIGARGWAFEWMNTSLGELGARQPGMGWG
ncbi:iron ABC transporter permease, partial [Acidovorax sp. HMWF029]